MAPTSTQSGVNKQPDLSCTKCGQANEIAHTIQCEECKHWIHYMCSALPVYILLCLARTNRKYTCEKCCYDKYAEPTWTAEAVAAIERQKHSMITKEQSTDPQTTSLPPGHTDSTQLPVQTASTQDQTATAPSPTSATVSVTEREGTDTLGLGDTPENIDLSNVGDTLDQSHDTQPRPNQGTDRGETTREIPNTDAQAGQQRQTPPPQDMRPVCRHYRRGICKHGLLGRECIYRHPKPCRRLLNHGVKGDNGCKLGGKCTMFHPVMCRNSIRKHVCFVETCQYLHVKGTRRTKKAPAPQESATKAPTGTPGKTVQPNNAEALPVQGLATHPVTANDTFLGVMTGLRTDMGNLFKTMEAQTILLTSLLKEHNTSRVGWPVHTPPPGQTPPWFAALASH